MRNTSRYTQQAVFAYACRSKEFESEAVILAESKNVCVSTFLQSPLHHAASNGHARLVAILLANCDVDPTARHNGALYWAILNKQVKVAKLLWRDNRVRTTWTYTIPSYLEP
jgi:ankyrin repeat protein